MSSAEGLGLHLGSPGATAMLRRLRGTRRASACVMCDLEAVERRPAPAPRRRRPALRDGSWPFTAWWDEVLL